MLTSPDAGACNSLPQIVVLDKLDYCASVKNLDSIIDQPNVKVGGWARQAATRGMHSSGSCKCSSSGGGGSTGGTCLAVAGMARARQQRRRRQCWPRA